jgi:hypothetical protein
MARKILLKLNETTLIKWNNSLISAADEREAFVPTSGLWAIWRLNNNLEDEFSTNDLGGSITYSTDNGIPSTLEYSGTPGSGGTANLTNAQIATAPFSISLWIYPDASRGGRIIGTSGNSFGRTGWTIQLDNTNISWGKERSGYFGATGLTSFTGSGQWYHLVMTVGTNDYEFYINTTKYSQTTTKTEALNYNTMVLGNLTTGTNFLTNVKVSSIIFYNRKITDSEVAQLYNNGNGV